MQSYTVEESGMGCLQCNKVTTHMGYNARAECQHCGLKHIPMTVSLHCRNLNIGMAITLCFGMAFFVDLAGHAFTEGDGMHLFSGCIDIVTCILYQRLFVKCWRDIRLSSQLYYRLRGLRV